MEYREYDDILGPEDLFSEAVEDGYRKQIDDKAKEIQEKLEKKMRGRKVVKNPRVTLSFETLRGNNGLSALKNVFKNFKFKGNGHEKEDLTRVMEILQQWMCYQLCPSYNFESCLLLLEALGKKRAVKTLMKKYRLGMDEWGENKSDEENNAKVGDNVEYVEETAEERESREFLLLLEQQIANANSDGDFSDYDDIEALNNYPQKIPNLDTEQEITLTPEQLERIAKNRKLAEERRMKRMSAQCEPVDKPTPEQLKRIARNRKLAQERRMKRMSAQCEPMDKPTARPKRK